MIKVVITLFALCTMYAPLELSRLIIGYPYWADRSYIGVCELVFIWIGWLVAYFVILVVARDAYLNRASGQ